MESTSGFEFGCDKWSSATGPVKFAMDTDHAHACKVSGKQYLHVNNYNHESVWNLDIQAESY